MASANSINSNKNMAKSGSASSKRSSSRSALGGGKSTSTETHELTSVDKKWGVLFSSNGQPTARFVEAMTSLSRYIVNAFLKNESIVLVPEKLSSFYNFHTVENDPFRYQLIFQPHVKGSHRSLAEFYQDIGCPFHLVQASPSSPPRIPGLTPEGFARWMALQLQAFPDEVAARLDKVISDFPLEAVSAMDGKVERLPKQLSRYLLPKTPDYQTRALLQQAVKRHFGETALVHPPPAPKPARGISFSDGEEDAPRRKPDAIISEHRRYNSYSGPASPQRERERERDSERRGRRDSRQDGRQDGRRDVSHSRPRQSRYSTEQSRRKSTDIEDESRSQHRRHQHRRTYDDDDSSYSRRRSDRPRSPVRPQHSRSSLFSLSSVFLQPARSTPTRGPRPAVQDGAGSTDKKSSPSSRRGPSPQSRGYRASLPEVHNSNTEYGGYGHRDSMSREARGHASESSSRRSSYIGSSGRGSIDTPPSSVSDRADDKNQPKLRDVCYKPIERRDRDDKSHRMYGSTLPQSPLSASPALQHVSAAHPRDDETKPKAKPKLRTESANTKAKLVGSSDSAKARSSPSPSARHQTPRPLSFLQPTVVSDDRRDDNGNGSDSDQTWDEYLRSSDSQ
ncbi:hydroxyproline-rich glycoprotein dz-hrgp [Ophiostoma piceae UAMH 11346]|uniref:Hydroxyproline-rich glycoprotein dz-hrgp n=1 Tax=Ophiostoma piceae (strain UAMH 11346) TaxID=1262450 RepID=S3C3V3_OPHP1|nr:hydroxyproline-rich glycoprotein dz-hrgp [Ophiostoma piceae UAMH 11346]